jgi:hypothetical protein
MAVAELAISKALQDEEADRHKDARAQKDLIIRDIEEAYYFASPKRDRAGRTATTNGSTKPQDDGELAISLAKEVSKDFATEVWNAFFSDGWAKLKPGVNLKPDDPIFLKQASEIENTVHGSIKSSNFEAAFNQAMVPDGAIGTFGLYIHDPRPAERIVCMAVPIREMEIDLGPNGEVDYRSINKNTRYRHLPAILPGIELPAAIKELIAKKPGDKCKVRWAWWRDWAETGDICWFATISVGDTMVKAQKLKGAGSCPFIVMRFNVDVAFAFGEGPLLETLPELRSLDEATALTLERFDQAAHPAFVYPSDSMLNFEAGIEPGVGYPGERHGAEGIKSLIVVGDVDLSFLVEAGLEKRIKRAHYVDRPEQTGDTPPTATQWIDEMALAQRRLGVPASSFWNEGPREIFLRFMNLLTLRGTIAPVTVDNRTITVEPYNPTERAKDQQEVQIAVRLIEIVNMAFPQVGQLMMDGPDTVKNLKAKLGDKIVTMRDAAQVAELMQTFAQNMTQGEFQTQTRN